MSGNTGEEAGRIGAFSVRVYRHNGGLKRRPWGWEILENGRPSVLCDYRYRTKLEASLYGMLWAGKMSATGRRPI